MDTLEVKNKEEATEPIQARDGGGEKLTPGTGLWGRRCQHTMGENGGPEVSAAARSESKQQSGAQVTLQRPVLCVGRAGRGGGSGRARGGPTRC